MLEKKVKAYLFLIPIFTILFFVGTSNAYYIWQVASDKMTIIATDTGYAEVYFDGGTTVVGKLKPVSDKSKGMSKKISVRADKTFIEPITFNLYLDINSLDEGLKHESFKFEIHKDGRVIKEGNFSELYLEDNLVECNKNSDSMHIILAEDIVTTTETEYTLYTWIDGTMNNLLTMESQNFDFTVHVDGQHAIYVDILEHNGLIPDGGIYLRGAVPGTVNNHTMNNVNIYSEGQNFPEKIEYGDIYQYGDYEYVYGYSYGSNNKWIKSSSAHMGWGVRVIDSEKKSYDDMLKSINNAEIVSLKNTFADCNNLEETPFIPETTINMYGAFSGCTNLVNAPKIPDSVTSISNTFYGCENLEVAPEIPSSVTDMSSTFVDCRSLVIAPKIPDSVTNMNYTFYGCENLELAPKIPDSVIYLSYAFQDCTSLIEAPKIPNSVTSMVGTFWGCKNLITVPEIHNSVVDMSATFMDCTSLTTAPEIPDSVTNLDQTFSGCTKLVIAPKIPENVTRLNDTFYKCRSLEIAPVIPEKVTSLTRTFLGCSKLVTAPSIPASVTNMDQTFNGCTRLTGSIKINSKNITTFSYSFYNTTLPITVEVPENSTTYNNLVRSIPSNVVVTTFIKE